MLPAKNRLNLSHRPNTRFLGNIRVSSDEFRLVAKKQKEGFKLAVVVSKKAAPRAVDRNRIRRIVSEALRNQSAFSGELMVIVNKNIAKLKMGEVNKKLIPLLNKLK